MEIKTNIYVCVLVLPWYWSKTYKKNSKFGTNRWCRYQTTKYKPSLPYTFIHSHTIFSHCASFLLNINCLLAIFDQRTIIYISSHAALTASCSLDSIAIFVSKGLINLLFVLVLVLSCYLFTSLWRYKVVLISYILFRNL